MVGSSPAWLGFRCQFGLEAENGLATLRHVQWDFDRNKFVSTPQRSIPPLSLGLVWVGESRLLPHLQSFVFVVPCQIV